MAKKGARLSGMKKGDGQLTGPAGDFSIYNEGQTSCSLACPAGVDIKAYVNLIADRKYEDAVQVIRKNNPFPGICGRVCTHPCEAECGRKDVDEPVSIRSLKRFASDYELSRKKPGVSMEITQEEKIAIVGSGPAGLTAASDLALAGFHVTVFDSSKNPGGLLAWGIPDFRLPKNIVRSEVRDIQNLGVNIISGKKIDMPAELLKKGYSAVILATGCQRSMQAGIPGESGKGVFDCLEFLRKVSETSDVKLGKKVIVVGGGNAALDSARTALRMGADVTVAYRRTEEQMPADSEEIGHAKQEGIRFEFLAIPVEIIQGKSMRFQRAKLGEPDSSGRRSPVPVPNEFFDIQADNVIMAIGSKVDYSTFPAAMKLNKNGTPVIDGNSMTTIAGIFAAGDLATGPSTIVDAIGSGHDAAAGVIKFLGGMPSQTMPAQMLVVENPDSEKTQRCASCFIPMEKRTSTFDEAEIGMDERQAITEAQRCQRCGSCTVCDVCLAVCDYRNALISLPDGEKAMAKVPFDVARSALENPDGWNIESGESISAVRIESLLARVNEKLCIACGRCEDACSYKAIRTVFDTKGNAVSRVEESACRGCGACVAACPTGAMGIGYLGDEKLIARVAEAVRNSAKNDDIVRFSCMWNRNNAGADEKPWEVKVQCTRRLSPAILLETLAMGARAISVLACADDECHYIPGPWMGPDIVDASKNILNSIGINPARIAYIGDQDAIPDFFSGISGLKKFITLPGHTSKATSGIGRCMDAAQVLMAQPDIAPRIQSKTVIGLGCLGISEPTFAAYGVDDEVILNSIFVLLRSANVKCQIAKTIHTTGEGLKKNGADVLYIAYLKSMKDTINSNNIEKLVIPTPKSYEGFKNMGLACKIETLPSALLNGLSGKFMDTRATIAYHPACGGTGEFDKHCLELLGKVPGLKIIKIDGKCGDTGWKDVNAATRDSALALLNKAEKNGAELLVAGSPRCAAHMKAVTNGWNASRVGVTDIYTYLASRLGGDS